MSDEKNKMEVGLYSLYDSLAEEYGPVFESSNDDLAIRATAQFLASQPDAFDFSIITLHRIAKFSHVSGGCYSTEIPVKINVDFEPHILAIKQRIQRLQNGKTEHKE